MTTPKFDELEVINKSFRDVMSSVVATDKALGDAIKYAREENKHVDEALTNAIIERNKAVEKVRENKGFCAFVLFGAFMIGVMLMILLCGECAGDGFKDGYALAKKEYAK